MPGGMALHASHGDKMGMKWGFIMTNTGRCSCGRIKFHLVGAPLFTQACHCTDCQRFTGAAFGIGVLMLENDLCIDEGEPATYEHPTASGNRHTAAFCVHCGTYLWGWYSLRPGVVVVRPGTLDDRQATQPQAHVWTRSKLPWVIIPDGVPTFPMGYKTPEVWPEASLQRLQASSRSGG